VADALALIIFILVIIWASRIEIGIAKTNASLKRIEKLLKSKEEKK